MVPDTVPHLGAQVGAALRRQRPGPHHLDEGCPAPTGKTLVDKYLSAAGKPAGTVPVELWYSPTHYGDTEAAVAEVIARSLEDTKRFTVKVRNVEWAEYGKKRKAGEMPVFLMGWFPDYLDPDDYLEPFADPNIFDPAKWDDSEDGSSSSTRSSGRRIPTGGPTPCGRPSPTWPTRCPYIPIHQAPQFAAT